MKAPNPETPAVYRLGLRLPGELGQRLKDAAWQSRQSVSEYVITAISERIQADEPSRGTGTASRRPTSTIQQVRS